MKKIDKTPHKIVYSSKIVSFTICDGTILYRTEDGKWHEKGGKEAIVVWDKEE